ncbi:MAG TPA: hypothetical protein VH374_17535 [Polyangia bacterium]|jgi:hypothetical protein|nr:hypothetical protein [Polyangia bacterium]
MSFGRTCVLGLCAWSLAACDRTLEIGKSAAIVPGNDAGIDVIAPVDVGLPPPVDSGPPADSGHDQVTAETPPQTLLWKSDLETDDFSEWTQGGPTMGGHYKNNDITATLSTEQAHSGTHAIKISFDTSDGAADHQAEFYRQVESTPAYYSAWFYIDGPHTPATYWSIFFFFYSPPGTNPTPGHGLWDVNLNTKMTPEFFNETNMDTIHSMPAMAYPIGTWFQLEAYYSHLPSSNGQLQVWMNGIPILNIPDLGTTPSDNNLYWAIGSDNDSMTPSKCTMYIDDAKISTTRVGP